MSRELLLIALLLAVGGYLGWAMRDGSQSKTELAMSQVAEANRVQLENIAQISARQLEDKLSELKANEVHTERIIRTEIIKPVFSNICATDEYVRLFNASSTRAERTLSAKFADPVPGDIAATER